MTRVTSQALNNSYEKERRKRCGFRWLWKTVRDDAEATWQVVPGAGSGDSRHACTADRQWCGRCRS